MHPDVTVPHERELRYTLSVSSASTGYSAGTLPEWRSSVPSTKGRTLTTMFFVFCFVYYYSLDCCTMSCGNQALCLVALLYPVPYKIFRHRQRCYSAIQFRSKFIFYNFDKFIFYFRGCLFLLAMYFHLFKNLGKLI